MLLRGPVAAELQEVDRELAGLGRRNAELLHRRAGLLAQLRPTAAPPRPAEPPVQPPVQLPVQLPVQATLLTLGALLLSVAGTIFTVLAWGRLGIAGRGAVLVGVTALAGGSATVLIRRGLRATADAVAVLTLVLTALDLHALRLVGAPHTPAATWWAGATALLAALGLVAGTKVRLPALTSAAVLVAQLVLPLVAVATLASTDDADLRRSAVLVALALTVSGCTGLIGCRLAWTSGSPAPEAVVARGVALVAAHVNLACAALLAAVATFLVSGANAATDTLAGAGTLLLVAGSFALATALGTAATAPTLAGASAACGLLAAIGCVVPSLHGSHVLGASTDLLVPALLSLALGCAARGLPTQLRCGPLAVGVTGTWLSTAPIAGRTIGGLLAPFQLLVRPWPVDPPAGADDLLRHLHGLSVGVSDCLLLGLSALALSLLPATRRLVSTLALPAVLLLPAATDLPIPLALAMALPVLCVPVLGVPVLGRLQPGWSATGLPGPGRLTDVGLVAAAVPVAATVLAWSAAAPALTLPTVALLAVLAGVLAGQGRGELPVLAAAVSALFAQALAPLTILALGAGPIHAGAALALAAAGVLIVTDRPEPGARRLAVLATAGALSLLALCLVGHDPGWVSLVLTGQGLTGLAAAFRPRRLPVAALGGLLLLVAGWIRLAAASVTAPEAYTLPAAVLALVVGAEVWRRRPEVDATVLLSPGLTLGLVPTLLLSLGGDDALRPILLTMAASVVVVAGSVLRLRAPLVIGGTVLAIIAVRQLGPLAAAAPRWAVLGILGFVLLVLGARYERAREELARLRRSFAQLG